MLLFLLAVNLVGVCFVCVGIVLADPLDILVPLVMVGGLSYLLLMMVLIQALIGILVWAAPDLPQISDKEPR